MINFPERRYPGPGRPPTATDQARYMRAVDALQQANPSDGGTGGIGVDSGGTQFRDWATNTILAKITGHGTGNAYSWEEVHLVDSTGTFEKLEGGLIGTADVNAAYEVNLRPDVHIGTRVELWPNYGPEPFWTFVFGGVAGGSGSGSGGAGGDLVTVQFDALSDVAVNITNFSVTCIAGVISATLSIETIKTYERVSITGPDLSISVQCGVGGPC